MWGRPREGSCETREAGDTSHLQMPYNPACMAHTCAHAAGATALQLSQVCGKDPLGWSAPSFCGHTGSPCLREILMLRSPKADGHQF